MNQPKSSGISFSFQVTTLTLSTLIIILLVANQLKKFCSADLSPEITQITPKTLQQFVANPVKVDVGMTITDFPEFGVATNKFQIAGIIWFRFDPSLISLDTIEKFTLVKGQSNYKSNAITSLDDGMLTARYTILTTCRTNLYYGVFPFEDHTLYLMLANREVDPNEVIFQSGYANFIVDKPYISGWDYADHRITTGFNTIPLGTGQRKKEILYPSVLFELDFFHHSIRYVITVLLPLLIIFFIDLFSLCFDQKKDLGKLVGITTANLAALVGYRFVIERMTPKVGYPTIADYLYFLFLTNTFIIFVINCIGPYLTPFQKKIVSVTLQTIIISVIIYLLGYWIPC